MEIAGVGSALTHVQRHLRPPPKSVTQQAAELVGADESVLRQLRIVHRQPFPVGRRHDAAVEDEPS